MNNVMSVNMKTNINNIIRTWSLQCPASSAEAGLPLLKAGSRILMRLVCKKFRQRTIHSLLRGKTTFHYVSGTREPGSSKKAGGIRIH